MLAIAVFGTGSANIVRGDIYGNNGGINLSLPGSWTDETSPATDSAPPGASDIARWDSLSAGGTFNLGTGTSWLGLSVTNPGSAITIGSAGDVANGLTLGTSGIDMSASNFNVSIANPLTLGGMQTWNIATARLLTVSSTINTNGVGLTVIGAGNISSGGVVSGGGSITMSGTGTLSLTKANTFSGGTIINSGTVSLTTNTSAGNANGDTITLNGGTLIVAGAGSAALPNNIVCPTGATATISGTGTEEIGGATVTGGGTINLSFIGTGSAFDITSRNIFSGFTGLLSLGTSTGYIREGSGSASGAFGGTLDLGSTTGFFNTKAGGTITLGALQASGAGTILYGAGTSNDTTTFSIGSLGISTVFAGSIQNGTVSGTTTSVALTGGTLTLTNPTNTYTGTTTISSPAILQIGNGGTTGSLGTGATTNNSVLNFNPGVGGAISISSAIGGGGVVNHVGPGITTLTGNNSYSGGTSITSGTLLGDNTTSAMGTGAITVSGPGTLGGIGLITAPVTLNSGGILAPGDVGVNHGTGTGVGTLSINSLTLSSGSIINYDVSVLGTDTIYIANSGGLTVNGGGIDLYQAGTNSPVVTSGTFNIFNVSGGYSGSVTNLLTVLNAQSGLSYNWSTSGSFINLTITGGGTTSMWNNSAGSTWNNAANWLGGIPNASAATASFGTTPGLSSPGTITLDGSKTVGNIVFNNSAGSANTPPTTYTIAQGTGGNLIIDNGSNLATISDTNGTHLISAPVTLNSSVAVSVNNTADTLTISGPVGGAGGIAMSGLGTLVLGGSNGYGGNVSVASGTIIFSGNNLASPGTTTIAVGAAVQVGAGGSTGSLPAGAVSDSGTLTFNLSGGTTTVVNTISGPGNVVQSGTGTLILSAVNGYTGTTTVNAGTLQLSPTGTISAAAVTVATGALLDLNGVSLSVAGLSGGGIVDDVSAGGSPVLTVGNANSTTFSGAIKDTTGTLSLVKVGAGTLTLSGPNTYAGSTNISAGVIKVATGGSLNPAGAIAVTAIQGLVLGNGVTVSNPIIINTGANEFVNVSDTGAAATLASNVTVASTASQLRLGITGTGASLTVTGAEVATGGYAILTRGTLIFAGSGSLTTNVSGDFLLARAGALNLTLENNSSITAVTADVGGNQTTAGNLTATIQDSASLSLTSTFDLQDENVTGTSDTINLNGGTLSAGSFIKTKNDTSHTAVLNLNGGTLAASNNSGAFLPAFSGLTVNVGTGGAIVNDSGYAITIAAPLISNAAPDGGLMKKGVGTLTLTGTNTYNGNTNVAAGTLNIGAIGALPAGTNLSIGTATSAAAVVTANLGTPGYALTVNSLALSGAAGAWTSKLDLANNDFVIHNTGSLSPAASLAMVNNQVAQGYSSGTWNGSAGIVSSAAASDSTHLTALGAIQNDDGTGTSTPLVSTFEGQSVSDTDVLLKYTYYGDANLDGMVDGSDYSRIDAAYLADKTTPGAKTGWFNGDFNYDGTVNGSDYTLIDNAFNSQGAQIAAVAAAQVSATSAVPEPAIVSLMTMGTIGMLSRRRRR